MKICIQKQDIEITHQNIHRKIAVEKVITGSLSYPQQDQNFPCQLNSIGTDIRTDLNIQWKSAEPKYKQATYSQDINNLEIPQYCNRSITQCLLILNWFVPYKFAQIFSQRIISKIRVYQYIVNIEGILYKIFVNSKVPYKDGVILFADVVGNSIFGCLFQKVIAKVYKSYQAIADNLVELLEVWTNYAVQNISVDQHSPLQFIQFFEESFQNSNLVFFRTRNSVRLQSNGLIANKIYIIVRVIKIQNMNFIEYLQLDGQKWKGKHSKTSQFWNKYKNQANQHKISLQSGRQNYMTIDELLGISRQIVIMHNTQKYNMNWITSLPQSKHMYKLKLKGEQSSHIIITINFMHINCRNSMYVICQQTCQLISCNFKQNKQRNFIAALLKPDKSYLLYIYSQNIQYKPMAVNVSLYAQNGWCQIVETNVSVFQQERSFLHFIQNLSCVTTYFDQTSQKNNIKVKNMYNQFGFGMIVVSIQPQCKKQVTVYLSLPKLAQYQMEVINNNKQKITYTGPCHAILMFKMKGKYQKGQAFPPPQTVKITISEQNKIIKSLFN